MSYSACQIGPAVSWLVSMMSVSERHVLCCASGLSCLRELVLQGCRNIVNAPGQPLAPLPPALVRLNMRNCDGLRAGALEALTGLADLTELDLSGCQQLAGGQTHVLMDRKTGDGQAGRHAGRQTDKQTDGWTERQTDGATDGRTDACPSVLVSV
jgi:hypothetical protein